MYSSWLDLLQSHFFPAYYIPTLEEEAHASTSFSIHSDYVFNRGIFKDVLGSTLIYPDYQYRCNQVFFSPQFSFSRWLPSLLPPSYSPSLIQPKFYKRSFKISMVQVNLAWRPCLRTTWPTALDTSTRTILVMHLSIMDRIIIMYLKWFFFADYSLGSRMGLACGSSAPSPDVFPSRGWEIDLFFSSSLVTSIFDSDLMLLERSTLTVSLSLKQTTLHPIFGILFQNWLKRMVFLFIFILWTPS